MMAGRWERSERSFAPIADLLPPNGGGGGQWKCHRTTLNGICWILSTGVPSRELSKWDGPWKSVCYRSNGERRNGTIDHMPEQLHLKVVNLALHLRTWPPSPYQST